jgi:glycosyltransferase involved in cell wall biosynthesis
VYAGRLEQHQKRVLDIVRITRAFLEREIPFEMTIAGEGIDQSLFLKHAGELIANYQMRVVGPLPHDALQRLLAQSDVLLLTSAYEGLSVSMLEAMAQGCVPVVTNIRSGVPEVIRDGENGFVVPIADIDAFVERLACLAQNPALVESMGSKAFETVQQHYRLDQMTDKYLHVFREMLTQDYIRPHGKILPPPNLKKQLAVFGRFPSPVRRVLWHVRRYVKR